MRIAMISTPFLPVPPGLYGGTERVVHELTEALIDDGHDVMLFATGDSSSRAPFRALIFEARWPPDLYTEFEHAAWALAEAASSGYDVAHVHSGAALPDMVTPSVPCWGGLVAARDVRRT